MVNEDWQNDGIIIRAELFEMCLSQRAMQLCISRQQVKHFEFFMLQKPEVPRCDWTLHTDWKLSGTSTGTGATFDIPGLGTMQQSKHL